MSATQCLAVGVRQGTQQLTALAESWNGTTWTVSPAIAQGTDSELDAVSCVSATDCVAVGNDKGTGVDPSLAESWNGTTWTVLANLAPGVNNYLDGVACATATACRAAGYDDPAGSAGGKTLIESGSSMS